MPSAVAISSSVEFLLRFSCLEHISYITNIPQMCLMLLLCHVCLLTLKYVSTVQYLSLSFLYIHNLKVVTLLSIKRLQSSYTVMRQLFLTYVLGAQKNSVIETDRAT